MIPKHFVTWQEVEDFISDVIREYKDKKVTGVYGLPRGGLIFAVMLSHRLHIPMLVSPIEGCMIVDDICDSGESLVHYVNNASGNEELDYTIVTMYYKQNKLGIVPDFWKDEKNNEWIVFPWEEQK